MNDTKFVIAVVDDEPKMTKLLKLVLEDNFNCEVEVFNDPTDALSRLKTKKFDAISLDHRMPKLTGMDLVKLLRTSSGPNVETRILLLTGYREEAECSNIDLLKDVLFLDKPVSDERYILWMRTLLKSKKQAA
ncbi:MAG: response regulator [Bdellovibrionaceae bacterium]|nr:response regulator [Pseudobdellovibrionaceae bacterium]